MEEKVDVSKPNVEQIPHAPACCICMRSDRKLLHLCLINGAGNSMFSLLCDDQDNTPDSDKEPTRLIICWECDAIMSKVVRFRQQACKAQERLASIAEGRSMSQNTFVLIPPMSGARGSGPEAILEYRTQTRADLTQPVLRVVRFGRPVALAQLPRDSNSCARPSTRPFLIHAVKKRRIGALAREFVLEALVLPDGSATTLPPPQESSAHPSSLLELLEGIHQ